MTDSPARRVAAALPATVLGIALLVALLLLPDLSPAGATPPIGQRQDHARIVDAVGTDVTGAPRFVVEILDGPEAGHLVEATVQDGSAVLPGSSARAPYAVGDEVVLTRFSGPASGPAVITEPWRMPVLGIVTGIFAAAVLLVGGLRGLRSLVALAVTVVVVAKVVLPLLLRGIDPILLSVGVAAAVTVVTLLITEGPGRVMLSASLGTFAALVATAVLAAVFTAAARFTALQGSEEIGFLIPLIGDRVDLGGILLAATVLGALGVLDDVTVTQAATVEQLHRAEPKANRPSVLRRAMRVGRSHIAATVNTLVLAYLGAGLPLLLLFAIGGGSPLLVLNGEIVAVEVIRALVGSIGIVLAVPLTTVVATWLIVPSGADGGR